MLGEQGSKFAPMISQWKDTANRHGRGIEEDTMTGKIEYPTRVAMHKYTRRGVFVIPGENEEFIFANPATTIGVRILDSKAHINRLIRCVEEVELSSRFPNNVWHFLELALAQFRDQHPGLEHDITMEAMSAREIKSYATEILQTQEIAIQAGISQTGQSTPMYYVLFRTPVHTVCPFVLHETAEDGHTGPSHTQRAYIQIELWATKPPVFSCLLREIDNRMQPCQSGMKISDEAVQVLRAYSAPTYTEDAVLRLLKVIRGIKNEIVPEGHALKTRVFVQSMESIFQNDMTSEAEDYIE